MDQKWIEDLSTYYADISEEVDEGYWNEWTEM